MWEDDDRVVIDVDRDSFEDQAIIIHHKRHRSSQMLKLTEILDESSKEFKYLVFVCNIPYYKGLFRKEIGLGSHYIIKGFQGVALLLSKYPHTKFSALEFFQDETRVF